MKILKFSLIAFALAAIFALIASADPFVLDPGTATGTTPIPVIVNSNGVVTTPSNSRLTAGNFTATTNVDAQYGVSGSQATVSGASSVWGGTTSGADINVLDIAANTHGLVAMIRMFSGVPQQVFYINADKSIQHFGATSILNATNGSPDLYVAHVTANTTNMLEIVTGSATPVFKIAANRAITHNGSMTMSNFLYVEGPITFTGALSVGQTNAISSSPGAPIAWMNITSTNGTTYKLGLYAQ